MRPLDLMLPLSSIRTYSPWKKMPWWNMDWDENEMKYKIERKYEMMNVKAEVD